MQNPYTVLPTVRLLATGTAISLLLGTAAFAADANAVAERLKAVVARQGASIEFTGVRADGMDIILEGTSYALASEPDSKISVGNITLQNVQDTPDGGYLVQHVTVPDFTIRTTTTISIAADDADNDKEASDQADKVVKEDVTIRLSGMSLDNYRIPSEKPANPVDKFIAADRVHIDEINASGTTGNVIAYKGLNLTVDSSNKPEKISYEWGIDSITVNVPKNGSAAFEPLGIDKFEASLNSKGSWSPMSGELTVDQLELDARKIGKLNLSLSMGGYDLAFIDAVEKTQKAIAETKEQDDSAAGLAFLSLIQQLSIKNMSIRFDNDDMVQKLLAYFAKQQGTDPAMLSNQIKAMAPMIAAQLNDPELTQKLSNAVNKFMSDPKSFTISATPDNPVTFATIVATASVDPTRIVQLLKVGVEANN